MILRQDADTALAHARTTRQAVFWWCFGGLAGDRRRLRHFAR